jgi:hypothetical protein
MSKKVAFGAKPKAKEPSIDIAVNGLQLGLLSQLYHCQ